MTATHTAWTLRRGVPLTSSPLLVGDELYIVSDLGVATCLDARTGEIRWEQILNSSAGGFPVSYLHDGVQYVAIAAGGGINFRGLTPEIQQPGRGNMLFVFRLP